MKKIFLAILAVGTVATAQAQKAGSILVYGNAGYSSHKTTDNDGMPGTPDVINKENTWNFSPGIGYQFNKNWAAGLNFSVASAKMTHDMGTMTTEDKMTEFAVGPFVRYTMPVSKTFFVFNQINLSYLSGKGTADDGIPGTPDIESKYNGFGVNWYPAVGANITSCMALTFSIGGLGYEKKNWDWEGPAETNNSNFDFTFGKSINIGIQANFGGRSHAKRGRGMEPGMDRRYMDTSDDSSDDSSSSDIDE